MLPNMLLCAEITGMLLMIFFLLLSIVFVVAAIIVVNVFSHASGICFMVLNKCHLTVIFFCCCSILALPKLNINVCIDTLFINTCTVLYENVNHQIYIHTYMLIYVCKYVPMYTVRWELIWIPFGFFKTRVWLYVY